VFHIEPGKYGGILLLCPPCLAARVAAVLAERHAPAPPTPLPATPQTPAEHRLVALYQAHPDWTMRALAAQLTREGWRTQRGQPWKAPLVRSRLVRSGLWTVRRPRRT
jgi:hypothetical protein